MCEWNFLSGIILLGAAIVISYGLYYFIMFINSEIVEIKMKKHAKEAQFRYQRQANEALESERQWERSRVEMERLRSLNKNQ